MSQILVSASFDDLRSRHMRFLQEAAELGDVVVLLWNDETVQRLESRPPKFPETERKYLVESIRYVDRVELVNLADREGLPTREDLQGSTWTVEESEDSSTKKVFCQQHGMHYVTIPEQQLRDYPTNADMTETAPSTERKKVLVTGCFDWFHSGHVRFFEEVSLLGDLYVIVGHDANIRLLKGEGHPMFSENERRYMAGSIRFVKAAFVSTGKGWLDAEPEIRQLKPDIYAVNEDGDRPEKREYCREHGIEYRVLSRAPKEGLPKRQSTELRGF